MNIYWLTCAAIISGCSGKAVYDSPYNDDVIEIFHSNDKRTFIIRDSINSCKIDVEVTNPYSDEDACYVCWSDEKTWLIVSEKSSLLGSDDRCADLWTAIPADASGIPRAFFLSTHRCSLYSFASRKWL